MAQRRVLVIGSQCKALGHLSFLPAVAEDIYRAMTDPELGGCGDALAGDGLKLDPTIAQAEETIEEAFRLAHENGDLLFLILIGILIGHGEHSGPKEGYPGQDFYFMPMDASVPPRSKTAIYLSQFIKELQGIYSSVDGSSLTDDVPLKFSKRPKDVKNEFPA